MGNCTSWPGGFLVAWQVAAACSVPAEENTLRLPMLLQDGRLSMDELCVLVERMIKERERSM
jgi:hypothetical protein